MIRFLSAELLGRRLWMWAVVGVVLVGVALLGYKASIRWLGLLAVGVGGIVLVQHPPLGLLAVVPTALLVPLEIGTGSEVPVNPVTLLVPALLGLWVMGMLSRGDVRLAPSRTNRPLLLFLLAGLFSLVIGQALWDPAVPRGSNFVLVQLAQWAIFAFSAGAFWLTGNLVRDEIWLQRLTFFFLLVGGSIAFLRVSQGHVVVAHSVATFASHRAPFWTLLAALAGGQLAFNRALSPLWRLFLLAVVGAVLVHTFVVWRSTASYWVGVGAVLGVLAWLRFPRLRWPVVVLLAVLAISGGLFSSIYDFAGGDAEWEESGGSRMALSGRVIELTMRNPITGLGPAAYRSYGKVGSLQYERAFYSSITLSSHNNYVDLFSQGGLLGLGLFVWFAVAVTRLGFRLRNRFTEGFAAGYVNAMLAAWGASLVVMLLADWILPFVYNVGFPGFQASVLVWLFLGGLVALEQMANRERAS